MYGVNPAPFMEDINKSVIDYDSTSIIRNLMANSNNIRAEISYYQIEEILTNIRTPYEFFMFNKNVYSLNRIKYSEIAKNENIASSLKYVLLNFLINFNVIAKKANYIQKYQYTPFQIINVDPIKILFNQEINLYCFICIVELYRKNKQNSTTIYLNILYKPDKDIIMFTKAIIKGIRTDEDIAFNKLKYHKKTYNQLNYSDIINEKTTRIMPADTEINTALKNRNDSIKLEEHNKKFRCFNPNAPNGIDTSVLTKNDCISYSEKYGCPGKWDIMCNTNEECPFYKANKNYNNDRGGCNEGFCEMPVGVDNIGYHFFSGTPMCYNCGDSKIVECCNDQKDKHKFPNLITPDFVFSNDYNPRMNQKKTLDKLKMKVNDYEHK